MRNDTLFHFSVSMVCAHACLFLLCPNAIPLAERHVAMTLNQDKEGLKNKEK